MPRPLRIAALVKQIPKIEAMSLGSDGRLQREGIELHMNDYCRRAVTQGHELAHATGGTLTVVTLGPPSADNVLREAIACGADAGVHVTDPAFAGSDTWATARALAAALDKLGPFDLVLLGRNSVDADTGQVPPQLATLLDLPFATGVRELQLDGDTLRLRLEHDDEWVECEVELPAMLSCAERLCDPCKIKDPAVWATVDAAKISRLSAADLGAGPWGQAGSPTRVGDVRTIAVSREQTVVDGSVPEQVAAIMAVLDDRAALVSAGAEDGSAEPVPDSGVANGPAVIVAVEPARTQITRELLGAAAHLAAEIGGRVVAFGPTPGDPRRLAAWGADDIVALTGAASAAGGSAAGGSAAGGSAAGGTADLAEEDIAGALTDLCRAAPPWAVIGPGTAWGRDVLARSAATLGAGLTGDAVELEARDGRLVAWKPAFGGKLVAEIHCSSPIQMATVRAGVLPLRTPRDVASAPVVTRSVDPKSRVRVLGRERDDDSDELAGAEIVIGVGVGVSPDDYPLLRSLAERMDAVLCATRKVTDKGWMPRARQVGITGHSIAPRLFVSLGASGKFNHTVGMRAAGTIVAVNTDPTAPIFGFADIGVIADWRALLTELAPLVEAARKER
jgi:electron transfer flavoprotein alpha subunit